MTTPFKKLYDKNSYFQRRERRLAAFLFIFIFSELITKLLRVL